MNGWPANPVIYEVNTAVWLTSLSQVAGRRRRGASRCRGRTCPAGPGTSPTCSPERYSSETVANWPAPGCSLPWVHGSSTFSTCHVPHELPPENHFQVVPFQCCAIVAPRSEPTAQALLAEVAATPA